MPYSMTIILLREIEQLIPYCKTFLTNINDILRLYLRSVNK